MYDENIILVFLQSSYMTTPIVCWQKFFREAYRSAWQFLLKAPTSSKEGGVSPGL